MSNFYHVIKDPVHGTLQFSHAEDAWVKPFIDHPNFQRLRHIKQLGMGDLIFPGAVHSRFNHCLGCSYVGGQISHKIGLSAEERQLVMIAGLIHDIGHGPFSHAFEGIFHNKMIRHEEWTPYFLSEFCTEAFFAAYNRENSRYHLTEEKFEQIANMIMHQPVTRQVLADIVSSQLDADRLDYLLRDSHFCGVRYGEFDFRWMLHCMAVVSKDGVDRLGITYKGIGVVEHYLMARRLMMRNIYLSPKKLAIESLLIQLLAHLAKTMQDESYTMLHHTRLGEFLMAASQFNRAVTSASDPKALRQQFLEENYPRYKQLCDYDVLLVIKQLADLDDDSPACQLARRLQERQIPKVVRLHENNLKQARALVDEFKQDNPHFQDWQIALNQAPHQSYSGQADPVLVVNERQEISPIDQYSIMLNAISDQLEHTAFVCIDKKISNQKVVQQLVEKLQLL